MSTTLERASPRTVASSGLVPGDASRIPVSPASGRIPRARDLLVYAVLGAVFGVALIESEAASWFRIQEMFRFQGSHLFAVLGSAVVVAALGIRVIRRWRLRAVSGEEIVLAAKAWGSGVRYVAGGTLFGLGWALTGTCPGPSYALVGSGAVTVIIPLVGAIAGTWAYGRLRSRLPH